MALFLFLFMTTVTQVNVSVKGKVRGSGAPSASGGMKTFAAVFAQPSVPGISP